jgi:abequosyltransferase
MLALTIAITTRNRAAFLGQTLDSILPQLTEAVELLVLDGASTDGTPELVGGCQGRGARLRYVRLETNDGLDRDYDRSVEHSSGEYCWLMTDDDLLKPGAVDAVLRAVAERHSLIVVNAEVRNADFSRVLQARRMGLPADRIFPPLEREHLFAVAGDYLSFIGGVVIKRSVWMERRREPYFGSLFIHFGVIFQATLPGTALVIAAPRITIRYGNASWSRREFEIWMFKWPQLVWSFRDLPETARRAVCRPEPWRRAATLALFRAKGTYSLREYRTWLRPRSLSRRERVTSILIACLPAVVANFAAIVCCSTVRRDKTLSLLELRNSRYYVRNWWRIVWSRG